MLQQPAMSVGADATFPALPPVTRFESLLLGAGARLDRFVLDRYLRRQSFTPPAGTEFRERLARAREFYADRRFVDDPSAFFAAPAPLRASERRLRQLVDGDLVRLRFESAFVPVFPEAALAVDRTGIALWWRHRRSGPPPMLCVPGYAGGHLGIPRPASPGRRRCPPRGGSRPPRL